MAPKHQLPGFKLRFVKGFIFLEFLQVGLFQDLFVEDFLVRKLERDGAQTGLLL